VSIHADDEFSLRLAFESELDDVMPREGLATVVIERYRKGRRRRIAGAVGLVVAFAGIGVPLGLTSSGGGSSAARSSPVVLRLASYALKLPAMYHLTGARTPACAAATDAALATVPAPRAAPDPRAAPAPRAAPPAAASGSGCVVMLLMPPVAAADPGGGDPEVPRGASEVTVGRYHAWLVPAAGRQHELVVAAAGGHGPDLMIGASGLSQAALVALVQTSLSDG